METLIHEVRNATAYVTLNRPEALNGINEQMVEDFNRVIEETTADRSVRVMRITGAGKAFCVGADIDVLTRGFDDFDFLESYLRRLNAMLLDLETLDLPIVAAVNGVARAGGFELLLACDLAIAVDEAPIGDNHTQFGVMPGGGATQRGPRKIGHQRASEIIYTARWLSGSQAAAYGIVLRAVPHSELETATEELLGQIRNKPRSVLSAVKKAIAGGEGLSMKEAIDLEIATFMDYTRNSSDAREGFRAYIEKRNPNWE